MASMSAEARAEYLKKYLEPPKETKKKKVKDAKNLRIIEENTFLPITEEKTKRKRRPADSEDEEDVLLRAARKAKELEATKFKAGTFVAVDNEAEPSNGKVVQMTRPSPASRIGRTAGQRADNSDALPPQASLPSGRQADDSDASPPRRHADKDGEASPTRRRDASGRRRAEDSDASPPRRRRENGGDSDASPPRRRFAGGQRRSSDSDASPPRRDRSPARRTIKREAPDGDSDRSPPRRSASKRGSQTSERLVSPKRERRSESDKSVLSNDDEEGRFAEPRKRVTLFNRRKRNGKEPEDPEKKARESAKQKEWDAKYAKWSKGVEQTKEREAKLKEMSEVAQESFTRYADDEAMNAYLKEQIHDLDPMVNFYRTKQQKIEMKTGVVYPKYTGHWPPNRFSIAPGYRWDGVDRSNGFEAKIASAENRGKAEETIAYRSIIECEE